MLLFVSDHSFAATNVLVCPKEEMHSDWLACKKSSECTSIYHRCMSEAINRKFEKKVNDWLKGCNSCDASAIPIEHAKCKNKKCVLDPPYPAAYQPE